MFLADDHSGSKDWRSAPTLVITQDTPRRFTVQREKGNRDTPKFAGRGDTASTAGLSFDFRVAPGATVWLSTSGIDVHAVGRIEDYLLLTGPLAIDESALLIEPPAGSARASNASWEP